MSNNEQPDLSSELVQFAKENGLVLPQTKQWEELSKELKVSTTSKYKHVFTIHWILGGAFGKPFERFAAEIISYLSPIDVLDYLMGDGFFKLTPDELLSLIQSWVMRVRIFHFYKEATPERVAIISPFISRNWTSRPFIEAVMDQGRFTEISMYGFAAFEQDRRAEYAVLLSKGMELLRNDIKEHDLRQMLVKPFLDASKRRGGDQRPEWKKGLWSEDKLVQFTLLVKELAPKWKWIKSNDYDPSFFNPQEWVDELRKRPEFSGLFSTYKKLTDNLLLRVTDNNLSEADRQPRHLACVHAAHELEIIETYIQNGEKPPPISTLVDQYKVGLKLISKHQGKQN
jgi:hypothetical protein